MTVAQYKKLAESDEYKAPYYFDYADLERKYWKNLVYKCPIYGADVSGSITDKDVEVSVQYIGIFLNLYLIKKITCILKLRYGI
jgi:[histone H3]-trimethyl-L-lysine9/36 demethylase